MNTEFLPRWKHPAPVCSKNSHKLLLRKGGSMGEADTEQTHTNPRSLSPFATDTHPRNYLTYASLSLKWAVRQGCNPHKVWKGPGQEGTKRHFKPGMLVWSTSSLFIKNLSTFAACFTASSSAVAGLPFLGKQGWPALSQRPDKAMSVQCWRICKVQYQVPNVLNLEITELILREIYALR